MEYNNIVILNLIIFYLIRMNMSIYINIRYFKITQYHTGLQSTIYEFHLIVLVGTIQIRIKLVFDRSESH
jgi:hypothetical protein